MTTALFTGVAFLIGVVVGIVLQDSIELIRASRKECTMPVPNASARERALWRVLLIVTVAAQVAVAGMLIITRSANEEYARCTATWQQQFAQAYTARANAAAEVSKAIDDILLAADAGDRDASRVGVDRYVALRHQQDLDRAKSPLPALPEAVCGKASEGGR